MKKRPLFFFVFLSAMILFASTSGAFATWMFAEEPSLSIQTTQNVVISEFVWEPEEILPTVTPGQNFLDLYQSILENDKGGLNGSKDTLEDAVLKDKDGLVHGEQNVQGGNLKHLFVTQASRELNFLVEYVSDTEFLLYIYKEEDAQTGAINATRIQVYKTFLFQENGVWAGTETQVGTALVAYLPGTSVRSIDVESWVR